MNDNRNHPARKLGQNDLERLDQAQARAESLPYLKQMYPKRYLGDGHRKGRGTPDDEKFMTMESPSRKPDNPLIHGLFYTTFDKSNFDDG